MGIIEHQLIQVVSQIEMDRVPTPILKVDQHDLLVVRERDQDIILLGVVVAQHELISAD